MLIDAERRAFLSMACHQEGFLVAAGTELSMHDAKVRLWYVYAMICQ
jgi:hypothetical protein